MLQRMKDYPARLQAVVVAAVAFASSFGADISAEGTAAVATLSAAVIALFLEGPRKQ
jgi:hypothetical protein